MVKVYFSHVFVDNALHQPFSDDCNNLIEDKHKKNLTTKNNKATTKNKYNLSNKYEKPERNKYLHMI
ncbi:hypothetical protein [Francisella orientalis]|uniref:hypothetical protein n=1 Tax=Francisella orientalis TaxID=299583 RepID=UPI0002F47DD4|nr:hypothetical protein [Francisella orientalis]